ncbi:hypothetical protein F511_32859 [Dorcoceras hygrometricum]|uniref:Uncharacterized protein n=1 Tax=Dorcoceras hygrometricum TaxID=472368 RepID=A0A2Z7AFM2_9LAMI|nr:hypothetical protein F511_32859 [Dorcoceras hygrometricum]
MVAMFNALESTGPCGFLGYPSVLYEKDLESFFSYATVHGDSVISCVQSKYVGISKELFAGLFDTVTHERFLLMTAIHFGLKIYWSKILFDILKEMVTKSSKQAKGFAAQICVLLKGAPDLTLGEANTFPPLKIIIIKTVGTYVAKNKNITADEETAEPPMEKITKKAVAKRRPAPAEPVAKKKRTTVRRSTPTEKSLALVPVATEAEQISVVSDVSVEEIVAKVIMGTTEIEIEETETVEPMVMETTEMDMVETESTIDVSAITNYYGVISVKVLSNEEGPLVETEKEKEKYKEKEKETETETADQRKKVDKINDSEDTEPLSKGKDRWRSGCRLYLFHKRKQLPQIPAVDAFVPMCFFIEPVQDMDSRPPYSRIVRRRWTKVCVDIVQFFGHLQSTPPTNDILLDEATTADIPQIVLPSKDFTESFAQLRAIVDRIQFEQVQTRDVADLKDVLISKIIGLELGFEEAFNRQNLEVHDQKVALAHDLLEFRVETQENFHTLSAQLSEIIAYINRGRDDKKGEDSSSRGPQPPEDRSRPGDEGRHRGRSSEP